MFEGIGDNRDGEMLLLYVEDGEGDTVQANGAFFDDERAELCGEGKTELPATRPFFSIETGGSGIDMSLYDMPVETPVHDQASFEIDEVAGLPVAEIGLVQGFFDGGDLVDVVVYGFDGETDAVVRKALVGPQFPGKGGGYFENSVSSLNIN